MRSCLLGVHVIDSDHPCHLVTLAAETYIPLYCVRVSVLCNLRSCLYSVFFIDCFSFVRQAFPKSDKFDLGTTLEFYFQVSGVILVVPCVSCDCYASWNKWHMFPTFHTSSLLYISSAHTSYFGFHGNTHAMIVLRSYVKLRTVLVYAPWRYLRLSAEQLSLPPLFDT